MRALGVVVDARFLLAVGAFLTLVFIWLYALVKVVNMMKARRSMRLQSLRGLREGRIVLRGPNTTARAEVEPEDET